MRRSLGVLPLSLVIGCGGSHPQPTTPAPTVATPNLAVPHVAAPNVAAKPAAPKAATAPNFLPLPPAPRIDPRIPGAELAAELRLAADSAADQAALAELARAESSAEADSEEEVSPAATGGRKALTNVTWDFDVETYHDHDRVQHYLDLFQGPARQRMEVWLNRMPRYEPMIRQRLQELDLPGDLVYLALIESGFSNTATSRAGAVGMWQLMKPTARLSGLRVDSWVDERRDPSRATQAAVGHLKFLTGRFGSVYLAAAAYNAGSVPVSRGLGRLPEEDDSDSLNTDADFFRLYDTRLLRRETKDYVPKLIAAALIAKQPDRYGFTLTTAAAAPYDSIMVPDMTGLDVLARLADTTVAAIRELNPQYLRLVTPPRMRSLVRLPAGRGTRTEAAYASLPASRRVTFLEHSVAKGETLARIARRYGVSGRLVVAANPRLRGRRLRAGETVVVPTGGALSTLLARRMADPVPAAGTRKLGWHRVRRGETLSELADEYGVRERELRAWNRLGRSSRILAGQRLRVAPPRRPS